jgi:hypothetical protein
MIRVNRILAAIATWLNSLVWWRHGEVKHRPYTLIQSHRVENRGILLLVARDREMCPRDVGTIIFVPLRLRPDANPKDLHIFIDHLDGMAGISNGHTHQVTVAAASHWPGPDGLYDLDPLFSVSADLQGLQPRRDLYVRCILHEMADILRHVAPGQLTAQNWQLQFDIARKACMGRHYSGPPNPYPLTSIKARPIQWPDLRTS